MGMTTMNATETTATEATEAVQAPALAASEPETIKADELLSLIEAAVERGVKKALTTAKPDPLEMAWLRSYGKHFKGEPRGRLNIAEVEALQSFAMQVGDDAVALIEITLANWEEAATVIRRDTNAIRRPAVSVYQLADNVKII